MPPVLSRNRILDGKVLRKGTEVDEATAARLDPGAFGSEAPFPASEVVRVQVDETPILDALKAYAEGRGLEVDGLDGFGILDALIDADEQHQSADQLDQQTDERITTLLAHKVDEVNAHLDEHPEDVAAVMAAEALGEKRKGILEGPHAVTAPPA